MWRAPNAPKDMAIFSIACCCCCFLPSAVAECKGRSRGGWRKKRRKREKARKQRNEEKEAAKKQKLKPIRTQFLCPLFDVVGLWSHGSCCACAPPLPVPHLRLPACAPAEPKQMQHFVLTGKAWLQQFICLPTPLYIHVYVCAAHCEGGREVEKRLRRHCRLSQRCAGAVYAVWARRAFPPMQSSWRVEKEKKEK